MPDFRDHTTHPDEFEPITQGVSPKIFKNRTNVRYEPKSPAIPAPGFNEYRPKQYGSGRSNSGPAGRKIRPYHALMRALAAKGPRRVKVV